MSVRRRARELVMSDVKEKNQKRNRRRNDRRLADSRFKKRNQEWDKRLQVVANWRRLNRRYFSFWTGENL